MVSTKNRLFYCGLNPASLKSLLNSSRRKDKNQKPNNEEVYEEERDFNEPTMIDTSHMAGDIAKVNCSSTHFGVMSSLGYVYTWGVGKSGQLVRQDDDSKSLELIDSSEDKMMIASDVCCAGDCTFVVEKESGNLYGCGFNSCGQLGKMESDDEQAVMMIRTKKRVVKVRQPSNIYFKLREIPGLPKQLSWETENSVMSTHKITPPTQDVNQELLEWVIKAFRRNYDGSKMIQNCVKAENFAAASVLETMAENHEQALQHNLAGASKNKTSSLEAINKYLASIDFTKHPQVEQACRFLTIIIKHWSKYQLPGCDLEEILESHRQVPSWGPCLCSSIKEIIASADESAEWIAANLTPVFILKCINDSAKWNAEEGREVLVLNSSITSSSSGRVNLASSNGSSTSDSSAPGKRFADDTSSSSSLNVLNGNVSFGSLCQSSVSK
ncbi:unnamed protein product [Orchesella dallaii]|uniref:Uncharacterized protein n=1 Tax=Orchesella dallaii TaxID=48710 RepID=A0ABP1Q9K2_9HEXA